MSLLPFFEDRFDDNGQSKANFRSLRERAASFLATLLNLGVEISDLCSEVSANREDQPAHTLLALARHNAANLDGIAELLRAGCVECCVPLLRSTLEATFGIAYITQEKHVQRALAYQFARMKRKIKDVRRVARGHPNGQQLENELANDAFLSQIQSKLPGELAKNAEEFERQLEADPRFAEVRIEWDRLKHPPGKESQQDPEWYTLFGGANPSKNIRALAKQLNWLSLYEFLYRDWSMSAHAGAAIENYRTINNSVRPLRYPANFAAALTFEFALYVNGLEKLATHFDPTMGQLLRMRVINVLTPELKAVEASIKSALQEFR